jgi:hypothetical protein
MAIQDPQESLSLQKFMIDMVYYLNEVELKYLTLNLRPASRLNPVPEELRGWNWHLPPLKPYYDVKLPMYATLAEYSHNSHPEFPAISSYFPQYLRDAK